MSFKRTIQLTFDYLNHQITAKNEHGIHSPFLFNLYTQILAAPKKYYAFDEIDKLRLKLNTDNSVIEVNDLGAGSHKMHSTKRKVSNIARHSAIKKAQGELLFRLVNYLEPKVAFELGTSLGLGTLYIQLANKTTKLLTFEGCENTSIVAKANFESFNISPEIIIGDINTTLAEQLISYPNIDFVFMDANHSYHATIDYFNNLLPKLHEESVVVIDDLRWSKEMMKAWKELINFKEVTLSLDFFSFGILFFRQKHPRQHFKLKI